MDFQAILARTALFVALWWVLTDGSGRAWGIGAGTVALATALSLWLQPAAGGHHFSVARLPRFLAFFLLRSVKSGTQVAVMALRPRLDLQPAIVDMRLRLPLEAERILLANILNLLPGTLSVGLDEDVLHLHMLDQRMPIEQGVRNAEIEVARLFGTNLQ